MTPPTPRPAATRAASRSALFEYALKGLFLGLWAYLAVAAPGWNAVGVVLLYTLAGTGIGLLLGCVQQALRGYKPLKNPLGFLLLALVDSPYFVYLGIVGGMGVGLWQFTEPGSPETVEAIAAVTGAATVCTPPLAVHGTNWLYYFAVGGVIVGMLFVFVRRVPPGMPRMVAGALAGAVLVWGGLAGAGSIPLFDPDGSTPENLALMRTCGATLLLGVPFFYLLTMCGETEESEVEIAAMSATLALGLYLLRPFGDPTADKYLYLVGVGAYYGYAAYVLPRLRVFKHAARGYGYLSIGRVRDSLVSFGRSLKLNPRNDFATRGLYQLHRQVDVTKLDPETIRLLNFDFCIKLATDALIGTTPTPEKRAESLRMLDLVEQYSPPLRPRVDYLKSVAHTHAKDFDLAAGYLSQLLDPTHPADAAQRNAVLYDGWLLALRLHPEMVRRLGPPLLDQPGRRVEAICAVERQLRKTPDDPTGLQLRKELYAGLTEPQFVASAANGPPPDFNYEYAEQLGYALADDTRPEQSDRGMAYLRMAGRGLPDRGPGIFTKLAAVAEKRGDPEAARGYWEQVKRTGLLVGPQKLPPDQRPLYFAGMDKLVGYAESRGDIAAAIADQRAILEGGKEDVTSLRKLAELHAKNGDPLNALLITARGLIYSKSDPDLLAKKDSYYYSVDPEKVRAVREKVAPWFDVEFCLKKAKAVADAKEPDLDTLDYGLHMAKLARVMNPKSHAGMVAEARLLLRRGERDKGVALLEDIREQPKGGGEEEDAWFLATRLLGDLYLNELSRPDLAVAMYTSYRDYHKSGAETLYQLGMAHEAAGNAGAALKTFEAVSAYKEHPRYYEAAEAVRRLKG